MCIFFKKLQTFIFYIIFFAFNTAPLYANSTSTIISEGVALITGDLDKSVYKQRAIENALQNITNNREQALTSFTIIENGQVLLDQIQSKSGLGILSYKLLSEKKEHSKYLVKIEAIVKNQKNKKVSRCRKTQFESVDFYLYVDIDQQKFPAWFLIDKNWVHNALNNIGSDPKIVLVQKLAKEPKGTFSYNLFSKDEANPKASNIYTINLRLNFDNKISEDIFTKKLSLEMDMYFKVTRKNIEIMNEVKNFNFELETNNIIELPWKNARNSWENKKESIYLALRTALLEQIKKLKCLEISPTLDTSNGKYTIHYGFLDGINDSDIFEVDSDNTQKFYFKVVNSKEHITNLELISNIKGLKFSSGQRLILLDGS